MDGSFTWEYGRLVPRRPVSADAVLEAATDVFAARGFVRAKMQEIAAAAGVATGSLYNVAASKEALFAAVFVPVEERASLPLPLPKPSMAEMQQAITTRLLATTALPAQQRALRRKRAPDVSAELHELLVERYDALAANWRLIAAVERTAADLPEVFDAFYYGGRADFVNSLSTYLEMRMGSAQLRRTGEPAVVARFVVESIAFWAYHRHEDAASTYSDEQARSVCVDMLAAALLPRSIAAPTRKPVTTTRAGG